MNATIASYPDWIIYLSTSVVAGVFVLVPLYFFCLAPPKRVQYRIMLLLIFFATSTITALLFAPQANLNGNIMGLSLTVSGAAAAFLIVLIVVIRLFPENDVFGPAEAKEATMELFGQIWSDAEKTRGRLAYKDWKNSLGGFKEIIGSEEEFLLRNLLENAYNAHASPEINDPTVVTYFFYLDNYVLKIQRVTGRRIGAANIRYRSNSSFGTRIASSVFLIANRTTPLSLGDAFTDTDRKGNRILGLEPISYDSVDCLIVTSYSDFPPKEDYLLVDMKRFSHVSEARCVLGVFSAVKEIDDFQIWGMRPTLFSLPADVPLRFRRMNTRLTDGDANPSAVLGGWLPLLDKIASGVGTVDEESRGVLLRARDELIKRFPKDFSFSSICAHFEKERVKVADLPSAKDVIVGLLRWVG